MSDRYIDHMAPAFIEGLRDQPLAEQPILGWFACQQAVVRQLEAVDWPATGLKRRSFGIEEKTVWMEPDRAAKHLMDAAFTEAFQITQLVENHVPHISAPVLARSKELLLPAMLAESAKGTFLTAARQPNIAHLFSGGPSKLTPPIIVPSINHPDKLTWTKPLLRWAREQQKLQPEAGCPAARFIAEVNGKPVNLLHYFWEKLVCAMYPAK